MDANKHLKMLQFPLKLKWINHQPPSPTTENRFVTLQQIKDHHKTANLFFCEDQLLVYFWVTTDNGLLFCEYWNDIEINHEQFLKLKEAWYSH